MGNYIFKTSALQAALPGDAARARDERARLRQGHSPVDGEGRGPRLHVRLRRRTASPARRRATPTGATSAPSTPTGPRRWTSSAIQPAFNLYNQSWPIRTGYNHDPPAKFVFRDEANARVGIATESLVSLGCIISGGRIHRSCPVEPRPLELVQPHRGVRPLRERRHRPPREDPPRHHRQGRRDPGGHRDRLQRRGGSQALLRQRGRHRRHPQARQARVAGPRTPLSGAAPPRPSCTRRRSRRPRASS